MKSIIQLFSYSVIVLLLASCTKRGTIVEGTMPSDIYDNEIVYWVPFEGASSKTVDSTRIKGDKFRMVISDHNFNKIGIIRVRPVLRLGLQDIVVFAEAGRTVQVKLDSISSASGTPQNDALQLWKNRKHKHDKDLSPLRRSRRAADETEKERINEEMEKITAVYYDDVYQIILKNKDNEVGKFIYSRHNKSSFTPEQISIIESNY